MHDRAMTFAEFNRAIGGGDNGNTDPYPTLAWLRSDAPVTKVPGADGTESVWFVSSYEHVRACLSDPRLSFDQRNALNSDGLRHHGYILAQDAPEHTRLRRLVAHYFTPRSIQRMQPIVQSICDGLLAEFATKGNAELVMEYAVRIPEAVTYEFIGASADIRLSPGRSTELTLRAAFLEPLGDGSATNELHTLVRKIIQYRQRVPGDDLTTMLIRRLSDGDLRDASELEGMVYLLLTTSQLSTGAFIAGAIARLLHEPAHVANLIADPAGWRSVADEALRYDSSVQMTMPRYALEDLEVAGQQIRKGEGVVVSLAAANRDHYRFDLAEEFCPARGSNAHLAFGYGAHFCIGASLSRLEGETALSALFRTLPDLRLEIAFEDLVWILGPMLRSPRELPVSFTPVVAG